MGVIDNLGYVAEASHYPCPDASASIVIEAAGRALAPVLVNALTFSCLDILKMRAGVSPWHSRGLRALIKGAISPAEADQANKIFKYLLPLEKALFFWFVVDLTTEFAAGWTSQIFKLGGCSGPSEDCNYSGNNPTGVWAGGEGFVTIAYNITSHTGLCIPDVQGATISVNNYWSIYFNVSPRPIILGDDIGNVETRLLDISAHPYFFTPQNTPPPWFGNTVSASYQRKRGPDPVDTHVLRWQFSANKPARAESGSCSVAISRFPIFSQSIIPVNCLGKPAAGIISDFG